MRVSKHIIRRLAILAIAVAPIGAATAKTAGEPNSRASEDLSDESDFSDFSDFEEQPYYILVGEAEKAAAEGLWQEAADRLNEAINADPGNELNVLLMGNLGMIYSQQGLDSLGIATIDKALAIAPAMTILHLHRGRINLKRNHDAEALDDFSHTIEADSLCLDARYYRGLMLLYRGDASGAEADLTVLADGRPEAIETAVAMSTLYSMTGRNNKAVPYLRRLCTDDPAPEYYATLAGCYLAEDHLAEAGEIIADGLKRYPHDPELYYYRAWLNRERLRLDDAHDDARRAIDLGADPRRVNALFR